MYEDYFGFRTQPFSITSDPHFFYDNPSWREAFAGLCYGIGARKGFIVVTGEAGTGKTTLIRAFVQKAEVTTRAVFILNPKFTVIELLRFVLNELGIGPATRDQGTLTLQLKDYLFEQSQKGHIVALLIDEAQLVSTELLEELRLLSNLETQKNKLLQIVLVGQPELEEKLEQRELRQLKQRVALRCRLAPLSYQEVSLYIDARLKTAGFEGKALFDPKAVEKIALYSSGIPRLINVICDNALLTCYAISKKKVSAAMIEEVASDLQLAGRLSGKKQAPTNSKTEKDWKPTEDKARTAKTRGTPTRVSQRQLAEFQDFFIAEEQRRMSTPRRRSGLGLSAGFVFGIIAAGGLGAIFYSQFSRNDISDLAARIGIGTNMTEILKNTAVESRPLEQEPSKETKDLQGLVFENPSTPGQEPRDGNVVVDTEVTSEKNKTDTAQAPESPVQAQEKQTPKNNRKPSEAVETVTKRPSENWEYRPSPNDRLKLGIYKAIANRAITGVEVYVIDGTVVLRGRVATESQKIAAAQAARSVPGVKNLRDQIVVNDGAAPQYSRIRSDQTSYGG